LRLKNLSVRYSKDKTPIFFNQLEHKIPTRRRRVGDRVGDGFSSGQFLVPALSLLISAGQRGTTSGLDTDKDGQMAKEAFFFQILEGADEADQVSTGTDRHKQVAGSSAAELKKNLEPCHFVSFNPQRVYRIHKVDHYCPIIS